MKIVLPTLHVRRSAQAVPLAAACLAAALPGKFRKHTHLLNFFPNQDQDAMTEEILSLKPDLVAFPMYVWNRQTILSLAHKLKKKKPSIFLAAGGPEATTDPEEIMKDRALDAVISGEGERPFCKLLEALTGDKDLSHINGLFFRDRQNVLRGPEPKLIENLDELPSPWLSGTLKPEAGGGVLWETSRGCPFGCDFCFDGRGIAGVRHICEDRMRKELKQFARAKVSQVWVLDSTFNFPPERGKKLLRLIARHAPDIHFHLEAKMDFLDRETARLLAQTPCSVQIGLQSTSPEVLRNVHRTFDLELFTRKVRLLEAEGVTFGLDLIYGLPGDTHEGFKDSLNTALSFTPNQVDIFPLSVLPGTPLYKNKAKFGIQAMDAPPYEIQRSSTMPPAELEKNRLLAAATNIFYNNGRAVGFFSSLLKATGITPAIFLQKFAQWALQNKNIEKNRFLNAEEWKSKTILDLQEGYVKFILKKQRKTNLLPAALDLMRYHYNYAETLLGAETLPPCEPMRLTDPWKTPLRLAPSARLVSFSYEILDLLEMGEVDLEQFAAMFRPVGSKALFLRRGSQVFSESLEDDFAKLLNGCDGTKTPMEIFAGSISPREGREIVEFGLAEGFLVPA